MNKILTAIKKMAFSLFFNDDNKDKIITELNKKINIPFASEKDEKMLLEGIYESLEDAFKEILEDKPEPKKKSGL